MSTFTPKLIVISSPSGGGKTTVSERVVKMMQGKAVRAVTATTRAPRKGEVQGADYHFLSEEEFDAHVKAGDFLEWAQVHSKRYGTLKQEVSRLMDQGKSVMLVIDVQGAASIRRAKLDFPTEDIFIVPPGKTTAEQQAVLASRLGKRGTDSDEEVQQRIVQAREELARKEEFLHLVHNQEVETAVNEVIAIIEGRKTAV